MNKFIKLAVMGFTAFAFTACGSSNSDSEKVALTALESGGYVVNVSSALLSEDDNFDIYFCPGDEDGIYYILNETGDAIVHEGSTYVYTEQDAIDDEEYAFNSMNIWEEWPSGFYDVDIMTAGTVNPGSVVEGQTYDLEEYYTADVVGSMTVNAIETFDCTTLPMPPMPV